MFASIDALQLGLQAAGYYADRRLATAVFWRSSSKDLCCWRESLGWVKPRWPKPCL